MRTNHISELPQTAADLRSWVRAILRLPASQEAELLHAMDTVFERQHQLWIESKNQAIHALCEGFAEKVDRLQSELLAKEETISAVARYFETVIAGLSERSHRDAKTKLMNFDWFLERLEGFLAVEQRTRWCAVGLVDITAFKHYNDTLGHTVGDRIIKRVARILNEQIRGGDLLATERRGDDLAARDLHARFGGDEFCSLIPDLPGPREALLVAERFKRAVQGHSWSAEDERLARDPVGVDVGVVCLRLGPVSERRPVAGQLAGDLIEWADRLMYRAKNEDGHRIYSVHVALKRGSLVQIDPQQAEEETDLPGQGPGAGGRQGLEAGR